MNNQLVHSLVAWLNTIRPEWVWIMLLFTAFGSIILLFRLFGETGLYVYMVLAVIAGNIQVLKVVHFELIFDAPVALGTILWTSTLLCTDILTELYGPKSAKKGVWLGFAASSLMVVFMLLTVGFSPTAAPHDGHVHIAALFIPAPGFLIAGFAAFLIAQMYDVWMYALLKRICKGRFLWLRNNASAWVAGFLDNVIFSVLAWMVFASPALPWPVVWKTYILGTFCLKLVVAALATPILYLAVYLEKRKNT